MWGRELGLNILAGSGLSREQYLCAPVSKGNLYDNVAVSVTVDASTSHVMSETLELTIHIGLHDGGRSGGCPDIQLPGGKYWNGAD